MASLSYIWLSAVRRRRDRWLAVSIGFLSIEGAGLLVSGGDCPAGGLQREWGDPEPFFELLLPPRAARAAVPILAGASVLGVAAVMLRRPSDGASAR